MPTGLIPIKKKSITGASNTRCGHCTKHMDADFTSPMIHNKNKDESEIRLQIKDEIAVKL